LLHIGSVGGMAEGKKLIDSHAIPGGLLTDQDRYQEYWSYCRHIESARFQMTTVLSVVVVGTLGALLGTMPWEDGGGLDAWHGVAIAVALQVFVGFGAFYMVAHKENFNWYYRQLMAMDPPIGAKPESDVFGWLLGMLALLQITLGVSAFVMSGAHPLSWVAAVVGVGFAAGWWRRYLSVRIGAKRRVVQKRS